MKRAIKILVACTFSASSVAIAQQNTNADWSTETNNFTKGRVGIGAQADTSFLFTINQQTTKRYGEHNFMQLINANNFKLFDITGTTYGTNGALSLCLYTYDKNRTVELRNNGASDFLHGVRLGERNNLTELITFGKIRINSADEKKNDFYLKTNNANGLMIEDDIEKGTSLTVLTKNANKRIIAVGADTAKATFQVFGDGTVVAKNVYAENVKTDKAALSKKWPDYVFKSSYTLRSISEVEQYIAQNGHLPDVPSQSDVTANGVDLGEMNAVLLKKVEELTLYMIQLQKQNEQLQKKVEQLGKN